MKKIILAILFAILGVSVKAQEGVLDTIAGYYGYSTDSVIVFTSAEYYGCPNNYTINTQNMPSAVDYFNDYNFAVNPPVYNSVTGSWIPPFQVNFMLTAKNNYEVEAYAQPHHFDSVVYVCGVAAHVGGQINQVDKNWLLLDENFDTLAMTSVYPWYNGPVTWQNLELRYYYFPEPVPVQDFYIAGEQYIYEKDAPITDSWFRPSLAYYHTRSIFDTIWQDTIIGCQASESPWLYRRGEWKPFSEDSVFQFIQKTFLDFHPILVMNTEALRSLKDADIGRSCMVYPNPTDGKCEIRSDYKIIDIELMDIQGRLIKAEKVGGNVYSLDISFLTDGVYIVNINTDRGSVKKKVVKR